MPLRPPQPVRENGCGGASAIRLEPGHRPGGRGLDLQLPDTDAAEALRSGDGYRETMRVLAASTKYEWTARITHRMHGH